MLFFSLIGELNALCGYSSETTARVAPPHASTIGHFGGWRPIKGWPWLLCMRVYVRAAIACWDVLRVCVVCAVVFFIGDTPAICDLPELVNRVP